MPDRSQRWANSTPAILTEIRSNPVSVGGPTQYALDGRTGEVTVQLVDERKFKVFGELIPKANRAVAEETGQLPNRVEGLDQRWTPQMLGLSSGGGIDYAAIAQRRRELEAAAPEREAAARERETERKAQWESLNSAVLA